jgi:antitoxin MazE
MNMTVRSKVVKIGNSRGIRIPRTLLEQADLSGEIEMTVEGNKLVIQSARSQRDGWEEKFSAMAKNGDDVLLDDAIPTQWDEREWTW